MITMLIDQFAVSLLLFSSFFHRKRRAAAPVWTRKGSTVSRKRFALLGKLHVPLSSVLQTL
jgi:hypothetical protein